MSNAPVIVWFRQDLRLDDNPALDEACQTGAPVLALYILDDENAKEWAAGGASRWWLHYSLKAFNQSLGGKLCILRGKSDAIVPKLAHDLSAQGVFVNNCPEPWRIAHDKKIASMLEKDGREFHAFDGNLLEPPQSLLKDDGTPFKIFTPFYKRLMNMGPPAPPQNAPKKINHAPVPKDALSVDDLALLPKKIRWDTKMEQYWTPGEKGAMERAQDFIEDDIEGYPRARDTPSSGGVSHLSPHLHRGEISPRRLWHMANKSAGAVAEPFLRQLAWREFSRSLLLHWPKLPTEPLRPDFKEFPWLKDPKGLKRWQQGMTGYPIVDAGMRELWETGWMHNRVRMIVGSFLVKNLLIHWHEGEKWFWDTLVDADLANNSASWQWIAGCGTDAAPYFRIFNPTLQGEKFDPYGIYVRKWVPELKDMPDKFIHEPWEAPPLLHSTGKYPAPVGDHKTMRDRALAAFKSIKIGDDDL